eukprot:TRINITY_DN61363_c0_g1_i1.p1 TRINITY_DN61363_c0_g1~~TRINITY_DN61363_c0_g1_i1.p1  ORF type:complete len:1080 (+),score=143.27 TRINITY_DN61363_c0_g1_i1:146-3241(+)
MAHLRHHRHSHGRVDPLVGAESGSTQLPPNFAASSEKLGEVVLEDYSGPSLVCMHQQSAETVVDCEAFRLSFFAKSTRAKALKVFISAFERRRLRDGWLITALTILDRLSAVNGSREQHQKVPEVIVAELIAAVLISLKLAPAEVELDASLRDIVHEIAKVSPDDNDWWSGVVDAEFHICRSLRWRVASPNALDMSVILGLQIAIAGRSVADEAWPGFVEGRLPAPNTHVEALRPRFALLSGCLVEIGIVHAAENMYMDATPAVAVALAAMHLALHSFGSKPPAPCLDALQDAQLQTLRSESPDLMRRLVATIYQSWRFLDANSPVALKWRSRANLMGGLLPAAPPRGSFPDTLVWKPQRVRVSSQRVAEPSETAQSAQEQDMLRRIPLQTPPRRPTGVAVRDRSSQLKVGPKSKDTLAIDNHEASPDKRRSEMSEGVSDGLKPRTNTGRVASSSRETSTRKSDCVLSAVSCDPPNVDETSLRKSREMTGAEADARELGAVQASTIDDEVQADRASTKAPTSCEMYVQTAGMPLVVGACASSDSPSARETSRFEIRSVVAAAEVAAVCAKENLQGSEADVCTSKQADCPVQKDDIAAATSEHFTHLALEEAASDYCEGETTTGKQPIEGACVEATFAAELSPIVIDVSPADAETLDCHIVIAGECRESENHIDTMKSAPAVEKARRTAETPVHKQIYNRRMTTPAGNEGEAKAADASDNEPPEPKRRKRGLAVAREQPSASLLKRGPLSRCNKPSLRRGSLEKALEGTDICTIADVDAQLDAGTARVAIVGEPIFSSGTEKAHPEDSAMQASKHEKLIRRPRRQLLNESFFPSPDSSASSLIKRSRQESSITLPPPAVRTETPLPASKVSAFAEMPPLARPDVWVVGELHKAFEQELLPEAVNVDDPTLDPCLRLKGEARLDGEQFVFEGFWAHKDSQRYRKKQKCVWHVPATLDGQDMRPVTGVCSGWYIAEELDKRKKFRERNLSLQFEQNRNGGMNVVGSGTNKHLWEYKVIGVLNQDNSYRFVKTAA